MKRLKWIGMCFVFFVAYTITAVNLKWDMGIFDAVGKLPHGDKLAHFVLIGTLTFFVNILFDLRKVRMFNDRYLLGSFVVLIFITCEESSQAFLAHRNFELLDMMCNYMGIFVFGELACWLVGSKAKPSC